MTREEPVQKRALDIAVVGCGVGGQAAALFLANAGHQVTLFERFETPRPLGAGLLLQPTGLAVLDRLGLRETAIACGARVDHLDGRTPSGTRPMNMSYARGHPDLFGVGIQRGALFQILYDAVQASDVKLVTGTPMAELLDDGRQLRDEAGTVYGQYDLTVIADGADSQLRTALPSVRRDKAYPWGAFWCLCPDPDDRYGGRLWQRYERAHHMAGILPVGTLPTEQSSERMVSFFWSVKTSDFDDWEKAGLDAWKEKLRGWWPMCEPLLDHISDPAILARATYRDVVIRRPAAGRMVAIGDAAHAMSPQLGQGANLALMDAFILGECFAAGPHGQIEDGIEAALVSYVRRRRAHVAIYQHVSRILTPLFQSDSRMASIVRDLTFPLATWFPPSFREAHSVLTGTKKGWLGRLDIDTLD